MTCTSAAALFLAMCWVQPASLAPSSPPPASVPAPAATQGGGAFSGGATSQPPATTAQGPAAGSLPSSPAVRLSSATAPATQTPAPAAQTTQPPASATGSGFRAAATPPAGTPATSAQGSGAAGSSAPAAATGAPPSRLPSGFVPQGSPASAAPAAQSAALPASNPATSGPPASAAPRTSIGSAGTTGSAPAATAPATQQSPAAPTQAAPTLPAPSANAFPSGPLTPGFRPAPAATTPSGAQSAAAPSATQSQPAAAPQSLAGLPAAGNGSSASPQGTANQGAASQGGSARFVPTTPSTETQPTQSTGGLPRAAFAPSGSNQSSSGALPSGSSAAPTLPPPAQGSGFSQPSASGTPTLPPAGSTRSSLTPNNQPLYNGGGDTNSASGLPSRSTLPSGPNRSLQNTTVVDPAETDEPPVNPAASMAAKGVVERAMTEFRAQAASGDVPLPLIDVVPANNDPQARKLAVKRYWSLAIAAIDLSHARSEAADLAAIPAPMDERQRAALQAAQAMARARQAEATLAFEVAQQNLVEVLDPQLQIENPIPMELPFIGRYRTRFAQLRQQVGPSAELEQIDRALPYVLESVQARGDAILALESQVNAISLQYRSNPAILDELLRAHASLREQRVDFLTRVKEYNHSIAEYSLSVGPAYANPEVVVSMLVKTPAASVARNPEFRRAAAGSVDRR